MSPVAAPAQKTPATPQPGTVTAAGFGAAFGVACAATGAPRTSTAQADRRDRARRTGRVGTRARPRSWERGHERVGSGRFSTDAAPPDREVKATQRLERARS